MKKKFLIGGIIILAICSLMSLLLIKVSIKDVKKLDFEKSFSTEEKQNINDYLSKIYCTNQEYAGFMASNPRGIDYYDGYAAALLADLLDDQEAMDKIIGYYSGFKIQNIYQLDFVSAYGYVKLMKYMGEEINEDVIYDYLDNHCDIESKLTTDPIFTAYLIDLLDDKESIIERYNIIDGIKTAWLECDFLEMLCNTDRPELLGGEFSRGAGLVYLAYKAGVLDELDKTDVYVWIEDWKEKFNNAIAENELPVTCKEYFAEIYYYIYGDKSELDEVSAYYDNFIYDEDIPSELSIQTYAFKLQSIGTGHKSYTEHCKKALHDYADSLRNDYKYEISTTYYALKLAEKTGFEYDRNLLKEYVRRELAIAGKLDLQSDNRLNNIYYAVLSAQALGDNSIIPEHYKDESEMCIKTLIERNWNSENAYENISLLNKVLTIRLSFSPYKIRIWDKMKVNKFLKKNIDLVDVDLFVVFECFGVSPEKKLKDIIKKNYFNDIDLEELKLKDGIYCIDKEKTIYDILTIYYGNMVMKND